MSFTQEPRAGAVVLGNEIARPSTMTRKTGYPDEIAIDDSELAHPHRQGQSVRELRQHPFIRRKADSR